MAVYRKTLRPRSYRPGGDVRFILHGNELARDLQPFHDAMMHKFPQKAAVPITLGGAKIFKRYVRQRMRPPRYPQLPDGRRVWDTPYTPSGGYGWYSGTLRRALHEKTYGKVGMYTKSAMMVNKSKGNQPDWARWGRPENAWKYSRWVEFGQVSGQPRRPIFKQGFDKGKRVVANWMMDQTWFYIRGFARIGRIRRLGASKARRRW